MVTAQETNLQVILEGTKQYQVPLYQRTYSWTREQQARLWSDLVDLADDRAANPDATHFIGSLVLAPAPHNGPAGVSKYLVVDGQQRLTTLTILLAAIRDHQRDAAGGSAGAQQFERINEMYLINKWEESSDRYKLLPTQGDRTSYRDIIESTPHAGSDDAVGRAYRYFRGRLAEVDDPEDPHDIDRLEKAALSGLSLVSVTTHPGDNVHRIFESLNNTGLQLTQGDLLRNYLFMRIPSRAQLVYSSVWRPLEEMLGSENLEQLFWLDLAQADDRAKMTDIYSAQVQRLDKIVTEEAIEEEVRRFADLGRLMSLILEPFQEKDARVRLRLQRLKAWGTTTVRPVLLHLLGRRDRGEATSEQIARAMLYVESFLVRRLLIGRATTNNNRILARAAVEVRGAPEVDAAIHHYLSSGRKYYATDAEVQAAASQVPFYLNGRGPQRKLVLQWIEESFESNEPVDLTKASIEHVLPQTLTPEWETELKCDLQDGEEVAELHKELVHVLGNLTLTGYNGTLGNRSFEIKKQHLARTGIRLSGSIAESDRWGRAEIARRGVELADRIADIWPAPTSDVTPTAVDAKWQLLRRAVTAIPAGRWTTYGDLAALIGSAPQPIGNHLATTVVPGAHRVLRTGGWISASFRWIEEGRTDDPREVLEGEGVIFAANGSAREDSHMTTEELADAISEVSMERE